MYIRQNSLCQIKGKGNQQSSLKKIKHNFMLLLKKKFKTDKRQFEHKRIQKRPAKKSSPFLHGFFFKYYLAMDLYFLFPLATDIIGLPSSESALFPYPRAISMFELGLNVPLLFVIHSEECQFMEVISIRGGFEALSREDCCLW